MPAQLDYQVKNQFLFAGILKTAPNKKHLYPLPKFWNHWESKQIVKLAAQLLLLLLRETKLEDVSYYKGQMNSLSEP